MPMSPWDCSMPTDTLGEGETQWMLAHTLLLCLSLCLPQLFGLLTFFLPAHSQLVISFSLVYRIDTLILTVGDKFLWASGESR